MSLGKVKLERRGMCVFKLLFLMPALFLAIVLIVIVQLKVSDKITLLSVYVRMSSCMTIANYSSHHVFVLCSIVSMNTTS